MSTVAANPLRVGVSASGWSARRTSTAMGRRGLRARGGLRRLAGEGRRRRGGPGDPGHDRLHEVLDDPDVDAVALLLPTPCTIGSPGRPSSAASTSVSRSQYRDARGGGRPDPPASERGLTLAVAENTRYVRAYVRRSDSYGQAKLGEIRMVRGFIPDQILDEWADTSDATQAWKREPYGCGAIMDCAPHMLYLLKWFFGDVQELHAVAQGWVPSIALDNHGVIAGRLAAGPLFSVEFCSLTEYPRGERVEIYGTEGTLVIDQVLDPPAVLYRGADDPKGTPLKEFPTTSTVGSPSRSGRRPRIRRRRCATAVSRRNRGGLEVRRQAGGARLRVRRARRAVEASREWTADELLSAIALALGAALGWGVADFFGGRTSRGGGGPGRARRLPGGRLRHRGAAALAGRAATSRRAGDVLRRGPGLR